MKTPFPDQIHLERRLAARAKVEEPIETIKHSPTHWECRSPVYSAHFNPQQKVPVVVESGDYRTSFYPTTP